MDSLSPKAMELRTAAHMAYRDEARLEAAKLATHEWDKPMTASETQPAPSLLQAIVGVFSRLRKPA